MDSEKNLDKEMFLLEVLFTKGMSMGCRCNQGEGSMMHIVDGQISSSSLGNLLHSDQDLSGMSKCIVSNFTSSSLTSMEIIDLDVISLAPSLSPGGKCHPLVSFPSLLFPLSSFSTIFSPPLVTPSIKLGRKEDSESTMDQLPTCHPTSPVGKYSTPYLALGSHSPITS
jgi:hypothetical protein